MHCTVLYIALNFFCRNRATSAASGEARHCCGKAPGRATGNKDQNALKLWKLGVERFVSRRLLLDVDAFEHADTSPLPAVPPERKRAASRVRGAAQFRTNSGGDLLSRDSAIEVPSALRVFTTLFGMGRGVSPSL